MKKLLLVIMVLTAVSVNADVTQNQLWFTYNSSLGGYSVRAWPGQELSGVLEIPATYNGRPVVEIPEDAFNPQGSFNYQRPKTTGITKVVLPASITKIGDHAFYYLTNLTEVDLSACVNATDFGGKSIFMNCSSLTTVTWPANSSCKLTKVQPGMFYGCRALTKVELPYSIKEIGYGAYEWCTNLTSVSQYYSASATNVATNYLFVTRIGKNAFMACNLTQVGINFQGSTSGNPLENPHLVIENSAFQQNSNLKSFSYNGPYGAVIGDKAFFSTALVSFNAGSHINLGANAIPKTINFTDSYYDASGTNYSGTDNGVKHDKYSHVDANGVQYFFNTWSMNYINDADVRNDCEVYKTGDATKAYFPYPAKRLGQITNSASTLKDNLAVESKTTMIDAGAFRGASFKTLTLNNDGELKYLGSDLCTNMTNLRELTIPSSVRVFHPSFYDHVVSWGPTTGSLQFSGSGSGSTEYGIANNTPKMAYLDMSTLDKSTFTAHYPYTSKGTQYFDEFYVSASLVNGTGTYRSNKFYYNNNLFDGMYEPTLVYLPTNTEDLWVGEDYEIYGRNFIFTNNGETPYCHLYEAYDYVQPNSSGTWTTTGSSTDYRAGRDYYAIPHDFIAETAKYNRRFTKGLMYTVCIPFAVDAGKYGTFYEPSSYDGTTLKVKPISTPTTQPRTPYVFVPNADYTALVANNVTVKAIPDGFVETKVATGTGVYVEDEAAFPDQDGDVLAKLCGLYETHQFGKRNEDVGGNGNTTNYGTLNTDGTIAWKASSQGALMEYPFHAAIWASNKQFTKIELEGDGIPEIKGVYRSTFNVNDIKNEYSNSVRVVNNDTRPMTANQFSNGTVMLINRVDRKGDNHIIATVTVTGKTATQMNYKVRMTNGGTETTGTFGIEDNVVNFNDLTVVDEFSASTAANDHLLGYDYQLTMTDALGNEIKTNTVEVPVYKTKYLATGAGYTSSQVSADKDHSMPLRHAVPAEMRMASDAAITGYELLRNKTVTGSQALKQDDGTTYVVNGYGLDDDGNIEWQEGINEKKVTDKDGWLMVDMQDCINPDDGTSVSYLPRISAKTTDFDGGNITNTYGGVENTIVACDVKLTVTQPEKTEVLQDPDNRLGYGTTYQGYAATVTLTAVLPNDDYSVYMYRLWRVMPDGTEVLLNDYSSTSANKNYAGYQWGSNYTELRNTTPEIEVRDVYLYKSIDQLGGTCPTNYIARMYARTPKPAAQAPRGRHISSTGYDAAEKVSTIDFSSNDIPTGVAGIKTDSRVANVTYYNTAGLASSQPFDGVNVVVTTYGDGTRNVTKVVK